MKQKLPYPIVLAAVAAVYFLTGKAGHLFLGENSLGTPVWPPSGLALAAVLLFGYRIWPGLLLGACAVGLSRWLAPDGPGLPGLAGMLGAALSATAEALAGAWLVRRFAQGCEAFNQPQTILPFLGLAAVLAPALAAAGGVASEVLTGFGTWTEAPTGWFNWWVGDMLSILILTPLVLVWSAPPWRLPWRARIGEAGALVLMLLAICQAAFGSWLEPVSESPLALLLVPVLLWTAFRFGQRGTTVVVFLVACFATAGTLAGNGPYAAASRTVSLLLLQNFLVLVTVMSLMLAADIGQRQRLGRAFRGKAEEFQALFRVAPVGLAVTHDPQCRRIFANPACSALLGADGAGNVESDGLELAKLPIRVARDGHELSSEELPMRLAARLGQTVYGQELDFRLGDGRVLSAYSFAAPLYDEKGGVRGSLGVFVDVTERKRAELALRESEERLRLALRAGRMGAWTIELGDPVRIEFSPELEEMHGLKPGEFVGTEQALFELLDSRDHAAILRAIALAITTGREYEIEFRFLPRGQPPGWLLARGRAFYGPSGVPIRLAGVSVDITRHKAAHAEIQRLYSELEERVQERTAQLEAINKELEAFSYSVSHDLRAPLRSIIGFSEVLLERYASQLDARGQDFLRRACDATRHMDRLIEDLLKLSRVGRSEFRLQWVNLSALAAEIVQELRREDSQRQVELILAPGLQVRGDEHLLRIALDNLLRNAWKFTAQTSKPRIEFGAQAGAPRVFFVRDNGAGFDPAYASKLFGVFQRLHSASEFPGTGIGLATVQRVVNRHGGRAWAEGVPGEGATFYFTIPSDEDV